jgi:hypothetical protein
MKFPYGISHFRDIAIKGYSCVDRTQWSVRGLNGSGGREVRVCR